MDSKVSVHLCIKLMERKGKKQTVWEVFTGTSLLFTFHWVEFRYMAVPNYKGGWGM